MNIAAGAGPSLEGLAVGVDHLDAIVVFPYGRAVPYAAWVRRGADIDEREAASKADRLFEIVRDADTLMVESKRSFMMIHGMRNFGVAIVFAREVPLGFARMASRQIASTLEHELPFELPPAEVPRSVALSRSVTPAEVVPPAIVVEPARVEPAKPASVAPPAFDLPVALAPEPAAPEPTAPEPPALVELAPPAIVQAPLVVEAPAATLLSMPAPEEAAPSTSVSAQAVAARPTVPSTPPAPPQIDFDADNGPDTSPPRSAVGHRVRAILTHIERNAPDGHIARLRIALRSGLGLEALVYPDDLSSEALVVIETAAEDILGVDHGKLGTLAPP